MARSYDAARAHLTTSVPGTGTASTHFPAVFRTWSAGVVSCHNIVKHWGVARLVGGMRMCRVGDVPHSCGGRSDEERGDWRHVLCMRAYSDDSVVCFARLGGIMENAHDCGGVPRLL